MGNPLKIIYVTSPFGWRIHPITKQLTHHDGIDLRANFVPVFSYCKGVIKKISNFGGYGRQIFIYHTDDSLSHYAHLSASNVIQDQSIIEGQNIAISGNSGTLTTAPHLHFGIKINGKWVDPMDILLKGKVTEAIEKEVTIDSKVYKGLEINGVLWVQGRETHEATGNQVNWTEKGTEIVPIPKIKLKVINELSSQK